MCLGDGRSRERLKGKTRIGRELGEPRKQEIKQVRGVFQLTAGDTSPKEPKHAS